jgi:hypothetical protein
MPTTTPLNVHELYLHLDREDKPYTVHVEMRVDGPIQLTRLEAAVGEAADTRSPAPGWLPPAASNCITRG